MLLFRRCYSYVSRAQPIKECHYLYLFYAGVSNSVLCLWQHGTWARTLVMYLEQSCVAAGNGNAPVLPLVCRSGGRTQVCSGGPPSLVSTLNLQLPASTLSKAQHHLHLCYPKFDIIVKTTTQQLLQLGRIQNIH